MDLLSNGNRIISRLAALLLALALLASFTPAAQAAYGQPAPASGGASTAAACTWNYSFATNVPADGSLVYLSGSYYIQNCGGVYLYATSMTYNTRADVWRCSDLTWLGGANITQAKKSFLLTSSFLAAGTCVYVTVNKMPWQGGGSYTFGGSLGT